MFSRFHPWESWYAGTNYIVSLRLKLGHLWDTNDCLDCFKLLWIGHLIFYDRKQTGKKRIHDYIRKRLCWRVFPIATKNRPCSGLLWEYFRVFFRATTCALYWCSWKTFKIKRLKILEKVYYNYKHWFLNSFSSFKKIW